MAIENDDTFCKACGTRVKKNSNELNEQKSKEKENKTNKKSFYQCPNCGAPIDSYTTNCQYCHTEIKNINSSESIKEFLEGLERIKLKNNFINNNVEVANYIKNYPVPNSKEDLIEFMILITTNINPKSNDPEEIINAWKTKMEQIYQKSKLTLKNQNDMKPIEDLYNSKKLELKNNKIDIGFYITSGICLYIALVIAIKNIIYSIAFIFFSLSIMTFLYFFIKGEGAKIFKTSIVLTKKSIKILSVIFLGISLLFAIIKLIKINNNYADYNDYYNNSVEKNNVEVQINFENNFLFNRYDVKLSIYDKEINLTHGESKKVNLELPDGTHLLKFTGNGVVEYVNLVVKGDTRVKYHISCHTDEIKVSELEIEYLDDYKNNEDNNRGETEPTDDFPKENVEKKIVLSKASTDFINVNYKEAENELKNLGFKNIKTIKKETTDKNNTNETVAELTIDGKTFDANDEFTANSEIIIIYWSLKEITTKESVSYSTNDKDAIKEGNKGIYAYKNRGGQYDIYWIIDLDDGYVYNFFEGNVDENCDKVKIDYGNLNDYIKITWHDGRDKWSYGLHFKYKRQPDHLIVQDNDGFELDFYATSLSSALNIRDKKTIKNY